MGRSVLVRAHLCRVSPVPLRRLRWRPGAMVTVGLLTFAGCASTSARTDATAFLSEHLAAIRSAAIATRAVEAEVSRLSSPPSRLQLERLTPVAAKGHRSVVGASEWDVAEGEEEDLPQAEAEVTEGANELAHATSALLAYARAPGTAALTRDESELAHGREKWNGGISQLWFLAHESNPPTV